MRLDLCAKRSVKDLPTSSIMVLCFCSMKLLGVPYGSTEMGLVCVSVKLELVCLCLKTSALFWVIIVTFTGVPGPWPLMD